MQQYIGRPALRLLAACILFAGTLGGCARMASPAQQLAPGHLFRATQAPIVSSPVAYDWHDDGKLEIAIGSWDGYFYVMDAGLRDVPGWPKWSARGHFSSPALGDLDEDGAPEILVGSDVGNVYAWRISGEAAAGFPVRLGYRVWASPSVLDKGWIAFPDRNALRIVDQQGRAVPGWPQRMPDWADATVATGHDMVAVTTLQIGKKTRGALCAWHLDGTPYPWSPLAWQTDSDSSPALADIDLDGRIEIIAGDDEGLLHAIDLEGRELPGFPTRAASLLEGSPAIGDLDRDGYPDIVVGSWDGRVYAWDHRGGGLPGWPIQVGNHVISSAALVDLDGDDNLDIVVGSKDMHLYGWTAKGQPLAGFPIALGDAVHSSPWVGDLEGDGRADIVVGANNGIHLLQNVGPLGRQAWPMFHGDARRSGVAP